MYTCAIFGRVTVLSSILRFDMQYLPPDLRTAIERMRLIGSDTQHFEVKSAGKAIPENLSETISAFANRDGGTIILGLDEKNHFAAVPDFNAAAAHDALLRLGDDFTPPCRLNIERFPFENNEIVVAVVEAAPLDQRPCYITKKGLRYGSFIRTGDGDKRLTDYEIERLREFHRQPSFDREPIDEASIDDLNASVLEAIVQRNREISPRIFGKMEPMDILTKLGAIAPDGKDGGRYVPTLAGLLSAGIYPQEFFPRLNITFTVYPGLTKAQT
ncbi:MAG: putative DNA binding domain-containing protein, partial [Duodenibacillus sp.]|nr:putative DNA binding domain-containing protein [Duodenibacillus sp.]